MASRHPSLTSVDLSGNNLLGHELGDPLRRLVTVNPRLQHLRLLGTNIPSVTIHQITARCQANFFRVNISPEV